MNRRHLLVLLTVAHYEMNHEMKNLFSDAIDYLKDLKYIAVRCVSYGFGENEPEEQWLITDKGEELLRKMEALLPYQGV